MFVSSRHQPTARPTRVPRGDCRTDAPACVMEIESAQLTTCDVTRDGEVIRIKFVDTAGNPVSLKLPFAQAGSLAVTLPHLLTKALRAHLARQRRSKYPS
jgi:hypothetical protein